MKILKAVRVGVKFAVGFTILFALAAVIAWGAYSIGYSEGGRAVKRSQEPVSYRAEVIESRLDELAREREVQKGIDDQFRKEAAKAYWAWMKEHGLLKGTEDERIFINRANEPLTNQWPKTVIVGEQYTAYVSQEDGTSVTPASLIPVKAVVKGSVEAGGIPNDAKVGDCWFIKSENVYKVMTDRGSVIVRGMSVGPERFAFGSHEAPSPVPNLFDISPTPQSGQ